MIDDWWLIVDDWLLLSFLLEVQLLSLFRLSSSIVVVTNYSWWLVTDDLWLNYDDWWFTLCWDIFCYWWLMTMVDDVDDDDDDDDDDDEDFPKWVQIALPSSKLI